MKVYQLLEEERPQLFPWLWKHCAPYLTELGLSPKDDLREVYDKTTLFRGMDNPVGEKIELQTSWGDDVNGLIMQVRKDRIPRDTHADLSSIVDDMLEHKFDWRPRQQGMFATGRLGLARNYGSVYRVFPMGDFRYVWSPDVRDLTLRVPEILRIANITQRDVSDEYTSDELADFYEVLSDNLSSTYKDTDISKVRGSSHEVMIDCKEYLAIPLNNT